VAIFIATPLHKRFKTAEVIFKDIQGPRSLIIAPGAVLGIFIWVGQLRAKQILGRPTEVVYVGITGMTRAVWVGQERVWVGHGLIARTASELRYSTSQFSHNKSSNQ